MGYLKSKWELLREDLKKHLGVGALIGFLTSVGLALLLLEHTKVDPASVLGASLLAGTVVGERIGWAKEYFWDAAGHGQVDRDDYLYTGRGAIAGAVMGVLLVLVLYLPSM